MEYCENWDKIKERLLALWQGEMLDRAAAIIKAPLNKNFSSKFDNIDDDTFWLNPEFIVKWNEERFKNTYFLGEAVPFLSVFLGPVIITAFTGTEVHLDRKSYTGWQTPCIENWDNYKLEFDENNFWWKKIKEITRFAAEKSKDKYLVSITDMGGPGDDISNLSGAENACLDFIENPDKIKYIFQRITDIWKTCYDELYSTITKYIEGTCGTFGLWAPGKTYTLQSDFSCMISNEMFDDFVAPYIKEWASHLEYAIYHLDGPMAARHAKTLCDIEEIDIINWIPGAGHGPMNKWIPLLQEIQNSGKIVHVIIDPSEISELELLFENLSPRGIIFDIGCSSKQEADEILKKVTYFSQKYDKPFIKKGHKREII